MFFFFYLATFEKCAKVILYIFLFVQDNSGTIENEELKGFLKDLLELVKKDDYDAQDLSAFEETILRGVGYDKDGKISRKELTMILLTLAKMPPEDEQ
ncbi:calbindin-32-like [Teleopsis dalmanni]|uniref:calbindin-32-like n=1 Tax=Teleopsis dalmanni TaxID=139649 RepID=UPI0018CF46E9|nr:calbindin-32-like [Teleopsis dalmanni]